MLLAVTTVADVNNPVLGDRYLDPAGREVVRAVLADMVHQRLHVRFNFFKSEWFLDTRKGLPYFSHILTKPDLRVVRSIFTQTIVTTSGVASLRRLDLRVDRARRALYPSFEANLQDGSVYDSRKYTPFIVDV